MDHYSGVYLSGNFNKWGRLPMKFCDNEYIESVGMLFKLFKLFNTHLFLFECLNNFKWPAECIKLACSRHLLNYTNVCAHLIFP